MIDFAERLSTDHCDVSVCHCIDDPAQRRGAERMLSDLVETCTQHVETRVPQASIEEFLEANAAEYDLVVLGASTDRSAASRFLSAPTFERLGEVETDVAIVHR
jgi:nucleotide-binding universal stress UspA family protein